ncbi:YybH family protein [Saccharothrix stipae]
MIARTPEELPALFARAFNAGDPSALYEPGARPDELAGHLALTQKMTVNPRKVITKGDLALLIVDWRIGDVTGTATDVARRGPDGGWLYAIDNPSGVA